MSGQPAQARPGHEQHPGQDRERRRATCRGPAGASRGSTAAPTRTHGAEDRRQRAAACPDAAAEVVREDDDHQDLRELAELELERPDRDPARRAADAVADREREREQPELDDVQRPGEGLEPLVVERGRDRRRRRWRSPVHIRPRTNVVPPSSSDLALLDAVACRPSPGR